MRTQKPKQIEEDDKVEYRLILTIRQIVNDEQNMICYDSLCGIYPTLGLAVKVAKRMRK